MSTETLWHTLRTTWWVLALSAVAGTLLALIVLEVVPAQYTSTARVLVQPSTEASPEGSQADQMFVDQMLPTFIAVAGSDESIAAAGERLGGSPDAEALRDELSYVADLDAPIITVTGHGATPEEAAAMAGAGAETLTADVVNSGTTTHGVFAETIEQASVPTVSSSPDPKILLPAGFIVGALIALLVALVRSSRSSLSSSLRALEGAAAAPLLGVLTPDASSHSRNTRTAGVPTTSVGIHGRLRRLPHRLVVLVDVGTAVARDNLLASCGETEATDTARTGPELWRVPLSEQISTLPEDAVVVLVLDANCSPALAAHAAQFCTGHGIEVVGCLVVPEDSYAATVSEHRARPGEQSQSQVTGDRAGLRARLDAVAMNRGIR